MSNMNTRDNIHCSIEADENLCAGILDNPLFSTQFSNSNDTSFPTHTNEINLSSSSEFSSKRSRGGNFSVEEDLLIVSAWLNTSLDAVLGNEQKHKTYWTRLWEYFQKYKKFDSDRSQISLMNRWSTIQLGTNKFCGCYAQIEARHQSGINEQDKIANAKLLYQNIYKSKFQFEHCWNVLRLQPKWMEDCQKKKAIKKKDKSVAPLESQANLEDDSTISVDFIDVERPPGRKAEKDKKKRRRDLEDESSNSCVKLLQEIREEKKHLNEKKLELLEKVFVQEQEKLVCEQEKIRLEQMKEDERIMAVDTTGMSELLASYYRQRQEEIIQRINRKE